VQSAIDSAVRPVLEQWLNSNRSVAEQIVARIILSARAREASRAASAIGIAQERHELTPHPTGQACRLPQSQSPGHGAVHRRRRFSRGLGETGRDRNTQAILPLRGKVLNTEGMAVSKVIENKELADLVTALGCGIGPNFELAKLRYQRIVLLADADSDGHHITTLLLTFLYRHLPELIRQQRVFIALPPLYRIDLARRRTGPRTTRTVIGCSRKSKRATPRRTSRASRAWAR